jgi:hypothetical protein
VIYIAFNVSPAGKSNVYALDVSNGTKLWNHTTENLANIIVVDGGMVYASSELNGNIYCLDADSSIKIWSYPTEKLVDFVVVASGVICLVTTQEVGCIEYEPNSIIYALESTTIAPLSPLMIIVMLVVGVVTILAFDNLFTGREQEITVCSWLNNPESSELTIVFNRELTSQLNLMERKLECLFTS